MCNEPPKKLRLLGDFLTYADMMDGMRLYKSGRANTLTLIGSRDDNNIIMGELTLKVQFEDLNFIRYATFKMTYGQ